MQNLLLQSMTYIQTNVNVMSNEISEELINYWIVDSDIIVDIYSDEWIVFRALYDSMRSNQGTNFYDFSKVELSKLFYVWQQELKKVKASLSSGIPVEPFPILSIDLMKSKVNDVDWDELFNSSNEYSQVIEF